MKKIIVQAIANAALLLFVSILSVSAKTTEPSFDSDKPAASYNNQYSQTFSAAWDGTMFYNQWSSMEPNIFGASDISAGYLQFAWVPKRIIASKTAYVSPYVVETDIDYNGGSSRGGVVIRANPKTPDQVQEPAGGDPGFNREGIAIYPTLAGDSMIVQFTATFNADATLAARIKVSKPSGVNNLRDRGRLRVEDFGASVYIYFNDSPYIRIDLGGKTGNLYTSGTVYNSEMQVAGTFTGMEIEISGKVAIAQRDAALKLYSATIHYNDLEKQSINLEAIGKKLISDPPFELSATATSGLPVEFKLISGPATLDGNIITLTGETGTITISVNQSGNAVYYAAPEIIRSIYVGDPATAEVPTSSQDYVDNWVVTDALDRQLTSYDEAGPKRDGKVVGVFYYTWHGYHGDKVYDISKIIPAFISDPLSPSNPNWGPPGSFHFWGEPETGYSRAEDPWVIRRDLQMLSNAHVDFLYIDVTNAYTYLETVKVLCEVSLQMRKEGIYTPEIAFTTKAFSGIIMNNLYDEFYASGMFEELWFKWNGKPLILGDFDDPELRPEVKDFFTIRYSWAWTDTKNKPNHWQWVDTYPQDYGWSTDPSVPEQIIVSVAEHPVSTRGTSLSNNTEPPVNNLYLTEFTGQGQHVAEQWERALEVDPPVVMVTQWNEFVAQRFIWEAGNGTYAGRPIKNGDSYFVDAFTEEFNRDMVPMKGGHTDNFYYQLISNIRKYKGMSPPQEFSAPTTMVIDGNFAEWANTSPVFRDPPGDIMHRNYRGYDPSVMFVNNTGRNDILESKSIYDENNIYFYVKTKEVLSPSTDPNWMLLFLDVDRNKGTGWEGYDYVVNYGVKSETETTLKQWDGVSWVNELAVGYAVNGDALEISVPRNAVMLSSETPQFHFHWADNIQKMNDIASFFTEGESAPDRRFNFNYSNANIPAKIQEPYAEHSIPGVIEFENFDKGGVGLAYADADISNIGGKYRPDESVDIDRDDANRNFIGWTNSNEWLEYTVNISGIGMYKAIIHYAASKTGSEATVSFNGSDKSGTITFPSTGGVDIFGAREVSLRLSAGTQVMRFFIGKSAGEFKIDKIEFIEESVVYPGAGKGLTRSFWTASAGGRTWFVDSICAETVPQINESWLDVSPSCDIAKDFWNARWDGEIESLYSESYTFKITTTDRVRLWINNTLLIDKWTATSGLQTYTAEIGLTANEKNPIRLDFAESLGDAIIKLEWNSVSQPIEVVPMAQLFPLAQTTGISVNQNPNIKVYPNPAANFIKVVNSSESWMYYLLDIQGRKILPTTEVQQSSKTIDLSNVKDGIYFLHVVNPEGIKVEKLVKSEMR